MIRLAMKSIVNLNNVCKPTMRAIALPLMLNGDHPSQRRAAMRHRRPPFETA
jgi:hypothetical protein